MEVPNWYELALLSLAAWRIFHLVSDDDILDRPRRWVLRLDPAWEKEGDPVGKRVLKRGLYLRARIVPGIWCLKRQYRYLKE